MDKDLEFFKEECGVDFESIPPFSEYILYKDNRILHKGAVVNFWEEESRVKECAVEWLNNWYLENK